MQRDADAESDQAVGGGDEVGSGGEEQGDDILQESKVIKKKKLWGGEEPKQRGEMERKSRRGGPVPFVFPKISGGEFLR
jgi:hypothetical protein